MQENISFATFLDSIDSYKKQLIGSIALVAVAIFGFYYYQNYRKQQEQTSSTALLETLEELDQAYASTGDWKEVGLAAKVGSQSHKGSSLGLYFLPLEAQALAQQGDYAGAIASLDKALNQMSSDFSLTCLFKIMRARIKMESDEQLVKDQGLQELIALGQDPKNIVRDKALYYLFEYYNSLGNFQEAGEVNSQIQGLHLEGKEASPWAQLAMRHEI